MFDQFFIAATRAGNHTFPADSLTRISKRYDDHYKTADTLEGSQQFLGTGHNENRGVGYSGEVKCIACTIIQRHKIVFTGEELRQLPTRYSN